MVSGVEQTDLKPSKWLNLYGRRFTIEERFRDIRTGVSEWVSLRFRWIYSATG